MNVLTDPEMKKHYCFEIVALDIYWRSKPFLGQVKFPLYPDLSSVSPEYCHCFEFGRVLLVSRLKGDR